MEKQKKVCRIEGCGREIRALGLCNGHYERQRLHGELRPDISLRRIRHVGKCRARGCGRTAVTRRLCGSHYARFRKYGDAFEEVPFGRSTLPLPALAKRLLLPEGLKFCPDCKLPKPRAAFSRGAIYCKQCVRSRRLKRDYGITQKDYQVMLAAQAYECALCGAKRSGKRSAHFSVDHDHKTGRVRGLLCRVCNRYVVGFIESRNISLDRLRDYLKSPT